MPTQPRCPLCIVGEEIETLERLGRENLAGLFADVERHAAPV